MNFRRWGKINFHLFTTVQNGTKISIGEMMHIVRLRAKGRITHWPERSPFISSRSSLPMS